MDIIIFLISYILCLILFTSFWRYFNNNYAKNRFKIGLNKKVRWIINFSINVIVIFACLQLIKNNVVIAAIGASFINTIVMIIFKDDY